MLLWSEKGGDIEIGPEEATSAISFHEKTHQGPADGPLPLEFPDNTVVRLPKGASSKAKQSGWMLIPIKETTHGCCKEWSMLASWRNSEKFFMASMARRCLSIVSRQRKQGPAVRPVLPQGD